MKDLLPELDRWQEEGEEVALATLVRVERSAPRAPGARLALTRGGRMAGSVSGGCVESDVALRAREVLETGRPVLAHYGISDEAGIAVGLSCGGAIDVWIEPFRRDEAWETLRAAVEKERAVCFGLAFAPEDAAGARIAADETGHASGSIDPSMDAAVLEAGRALLAEGGSRVLELPGAHGPTRVFVEAIPAPQRLFVVGATHLAMALSRMASALGYRVVVIDPRSPFATADRFPDAELHRQWPGEVLEAASLDGAASVVMLSHDPKFDVPGLACALRSPARYVGALGSRKTQERRRAALAGQGFGESDLARVRGPIGLDLGARTPDEIALAILAEIVAVRHGRDGAALRGRRAPIHDR